MWGINNPKVITSTICANILRKEKLNNFAALEEVLNTLALRHCPLVVECHSNDQSFV